MISPTTKYFLINCSNLKPLCSGSELSSSTIGPPHSQVGSVVCKNNFLVLLLSHENISRQSGTVSVISEDDKMADEYQILAVAA